MVDQRNTKMIEDYMTQLEKLYTCDLSEKHGESESCIILLKSFDTKSPLKINLRDYIIRIIDKTEVENSTLLYSLDLLKKIISKVNGLIYYRYMFKLALISIIVSIKLNEDVINSDSIYSKIAGIKLPLYISLEHEFLEILNYEVFIH